MANTFLTAEWRKLIMAQYEVEPEVLAPWLPEGVQLDLYHGRCFVSLVGFLFGRVRLKGWPIPFHTRFEEVNLRFYVTRTASDGSVRRGVVFVREFVPRAAITLVARLFYEEPYATFAMRHSIVSTGDGLDVSYAWRTHGEWYSLAVRASADAEAIVAGSEEAFITEHYWGYTRRSRGTTSEYGVVHPQWSVYPVQSVSLQVDFARLYGPSFACLNQRGPAGVLLAEGSEISVLGGSRL